VPGESSSRPDWNEEGDQGEDVIFPIAEYDDLRVNEIVPLLGQLDDDELQEVRDREAAGKGRITVLKRIDDLLGGAATQEDPEAATPDEEA
jgi:hypothetical protein